MAKTCILCGEEISAFCGKKLTCAGYVFTVCPDCFDKYREMDEIELAQKVLSTGRSKHAEGIREYIDDRIRERQEVQEREKDKEERFNESHPEAGNCPKCGEAMRRYGPVTLKMGNETIILSDLNRLLTGSMTVQLNRCSKCGYTEFYTPYENELI